METVRVETGVFPKRLREYLKHYVELWTKKPPGSVTRLLSSVKSYAYLKILTRCGQSSNVSLKRVDAATRRPFTTTSNSEQNR